MYEYKTNLKSIPYQGKIQAIVQFFSKQDSSPQAINSGAKYVYILKLKSTCNLTAFMILCQLYITNTTHPQTTISKAWEDILQESHLGTLKFHSIKKFKEQKICHKLYVLSKVFANMMIIE